MSPAVRSMLYRVKEWSEIEVVVMTGPGCGGQLVDWGQCSEVIIASGFATMPMLNGSESGGKDVIDWLWP